MRFRMSHVPRAIMGVLVLAATACKGVITTSTDGSLAPGDAALTTGDAADAVGDAGAADATADAGTSDAGPVAAGTANLDTCTTSASNDAPAFYRTYFACSTITVSGGNVVIATNGLPPHKSYYWGSGSPNFAPFDTSRGSMYHPNPNTLAESDRSFRIPLTPVMKNNLTITNATVDGVVNTSSDEYPLGPVGVALDGVLLYNPLAAPGDKIDSERFTFDDYNAHPDMNRSYHYHTDSKGPLEVLAKRGLVTTTIPGSAELELYGIMCDGTVVLGCTELDGSAPATASLDAQNGHVADLKDKSNTVLLANRYHTHVCEKWGTAHPYTPEIQYYTSCAR